jgi:small subunit ribosomal protein S5e
MAEGENWDQPPEAAAAEEPIVQKFATEVKLFGKWSYFDLHIPDETLRDYIAIFQTRSKTFLPHTSQRW